MWKERIKIISRQSSIRVRRHAKVKVKVKPSHYRPGQGQRAPGGRGSQI